MRRTEASPVLQYVRGLVVAEEVRRSKDRDLLARFRSERDEEAFAALVQRHGPMVLAVCRRFAQHEEDAEDCFQATFLALSHEAGSLRRLDSLAAWLYGVAFRICANTKRSAGRYRIRVGRGLKCESADPLSEITVREAQAILDEELAWLPEKYRAPLILCCLEGLTRDKAAEQLGLPLSTLKSRLEEARVRLRSRLRRRGLGLSAALTALTFVEGTSDAAVGRALLFSTVKAGSLIFARRAVSGVVSARVTALTREILKTMLFTKVKTAVVVIVAGALLGTGVMVVSQKSGPADAQEKMGPAVQPGLASGAKPDGPSLGGEVTDKAGDDRAMRRALLAHAQSAAIDKLPRFSYQVKYRHGRVDSMRAVDVSLEHLNEGLTAAVLDKDWTGWCETSFSWDEKRVLSEMKLWKTRSGCSAKFWTASEAWDRYQADDNSPACFVRLAGHAQLWKNLRMFDYGYLRLTPHRYWWGQTVSPGNNNLTMSLVRPDKAAWRYLGTEKCGNETCDVVDSLRRGQRLWIGQDTGHVHRASACWPTYMPAGRDTAEGATFFKTDVVRGIAGKAFASGREYGNWCSNEATDDQIVQLETAFAERFAPRSVPQITSNELIQFEDYREIAPGVWLPFREIRTFPHPSETVQGKSVIIRSELCVLEVRTDLDLSDRFAQLLPKDGEEVEDQRFIPPVNFLYRAGEADE